MENKHTIYFNMCHHYRKIFNAKPTVDTSPPKTFQIKSNNNQWAFSRNPSPFRTKTPMQETVKTFQKQPYLTQDNGTITCKYYYQHHNKKDEGKLTDKSFIVPNKPFNPVILKTNTQSKLRNLRVYHPPRRKKVVKVSESSKSSPQNGDDHKEDNTRRSTFDKTSLKNSKRQSLAVMNRNSYSEESSEDSAYNEGEGALSSDSRGSTPQNLTNKHQPVKSTVTDNTQQSKKAISSVTNNVTSDIICIQFLKDITDDILKKNIFTNKALKSVFQQHAQTNKYNLEMERMQKEITKLQQRLGVPKDDKFDDENYGLGENVSISELLKSTEDSIKDSSRANSLPHNDKSETSSHIGDPVEDEETSKEHEYSEDFSDFENHSVASQSDYDKSDDNVSYHSEENEQVSAEVDEVEDEKDESIVDENMSEDEDTKSELESEISDIS